jgi:hypothetical protein
MRADTFHGRGWVSLRVRLRVQPGDFGDIEFESFSGMLAVLDGMSKSVSNTDWISDQLSNEEFNEVFDALQHLRSVFAKHQQRDAEEKRFDGTGDTEVVLAYRPAGLQPIDGEDGGFI